jgi:hypothetical protein
MNLAAARVALNRPPLQAQAAIPRSPANRTDELLAMFVAVSFNRAPIQAPPRPIPLFLRKLPRATTPDEVCALFKSFALFGPEMFFNPPNGTVYLTSVAGAEWAAKTLHESEIWG